MGAARKVMIGALCALVGGAFVGVAFAAGAIFQPASAGTTNDGIARATCGPGSSPETGVQGRVPRKDRDSKRSMKGYRCNLRKLGGFQGVGGGIVNPTYKNCVYFGSFNTGLLGKNAGVQVVDASDPRHPRQTALLNSTAFRVSTWEGMKVNAKRGLLVGASVQVIPGIGTGALDVYDVSKDCAHPRLLNGTGIGNLTKPILVVGHEGNFAPDGKTYYSTSAYTGTITATDLTDPTTPKLVFGGNAGPTNHGLSLSNDGKTMYGVTALPAGLQIIDVSEIQERDPSPRLRLIGQLQWGGDGLFTQMTIPFTKNGHKWLYVVDEAGNGGIRLVDIQDPTRPKIVRQMRLEISQAKNVALRAKDVGGDGLFGYESHYCSIDRPVDPTALACGYFQSGIRVFDIRKLRSPREVAYFNPGAKTGSTLAQIPNSAHALITYAPPALSFQSLTLQTLADSLKPDLTADWCMSPPEFRGKQLWVTCNDNGFLALEFTNGAYPFK